MKKISIIMVIAIIGIVDQVNNGITIIEISVDDTIIKMVNLPAGNAQEGDVMFNWRY